MSDGAESYGVGDKVALRDRDKVGHVVSVEDDGNIVVRFGLPRLWFGPSHRSKSDLVKIDGQKGTRMSDKIGDEMNGCLVAEVDWSEYPMADQDAKFNNDKLLQFGSCKDCGVNTVSRAKHSICPQCGGKCYGT